MNSQKSSKKVLQKRNCDYCGLLYQPKKTWQRFHKPKCHDLYWVAKKSNSSDNLKRIEKRLSRIERKLGIEND